MLCLKALLTVANDTLISVSYKNCSTLCTMIQNFNAVASFWAFCLFSVASEWSAGWILSNPSLQTKLDFHGRISVITMNRMLPVCYTMFVKRGFGSVLVGARKQIQTVALPARKLQTKALLSANTRYSLCKPTVLSFIRCLHTSITNGTNGRSKFAERNQRRISDISPIERMNGWTFAAF